ncbi:unnamed protein product [Paramecium pentaurelia]|uniref:Uncharacterized protein n=1 Tax=Paramecium pentaurelia TaxID=43138 RepID=A0A8S1WJD9_9CILI|nr:unnamed protein product [Paramecium pentaurelia]
MAFIYRSRNQSQILDSSPGPGSYELDRKWERMSTQVPSLPLVEIPRKLSPGPGAYDHKGSSQNSQVASAIFKNEEERFKDEKYGLVGPGYYDITMLQKHKHPHSHRPKIIEQLMYAGTYQTANSIPYEKRQQANVGPGYYDTQLSQLNKHASLVSNWSRRSSKHEEVENPIGPGHYDVDRFYRYRDRKVGQQIKLSTSQEPKFYVKKGLDNKIYYSFQKSSTPDSDSSQYEYLDDSTPGPGYYQTQSTAISTGAKLLTKAPRFALKNQNIPGPGQYNPALISISQQVEFPKAERFKQNSNSISPSPVTYSPKTSMKDKIVQKLIQSPNQEVGSRLPRFSKKKQKNTPGPGYYYNETSNIEKKDVSSSPFKSKVKRTSLKTNEDVPPPGFYDTSLGSIQEKLKSQIEYNIEQLIDKPPFGIGEERWKQAIIEESEDERIERTSNYKKPISKDPPAFGLGQQRFQHQNNENPDPLSYNIQLQWVKKSFNFQQIKK